MDKLRHTGSLCTDASPGQVTCLNTVILDVCVSR